MAEVRSVSAATTGPDTLLVIGDGQETAVLTRVAQKRIGAFHQTFLGELGHTVTDYTVPFHLAESQAAFSGTPLGRLPSEHNQRP